VQHKAKKGGVRCFRWVRGSVRKGGGQIESVKFRWGGTSAAQENDESRSGRQGKICPLKVIRGGSQVG